MTVTEPREAKVFRFLRCNYDGATGNAALVYALDDGPELIETIGFPDAPQDLPAPRRAAFLRALQWLHLVAGISYYKAALPPTIRIEGEGIDAASAERLTTIYLQGLGEFAHQNRLDLRGRIIFPATAAAAAAPAPLDLPRRTLVPIGGGKDSLVTVEMLRSLGEPMTAVWVGQSALIAATATATGLPLLNIGRSLSPLLFEMNRAGAWNGHIPVTAINSAILIAASLLYGFDAIAFSNERSASSANLVVDGFAINHQWSKGLDFERLLRAQIQCQIAPDLDYFSALRPWSELAVTRRFAALSQYHGVFSSCNRNFRILAERPASRWCGQCPKCHFVFLALAPFLPKPSLLAIFGRNYLDDATLAADYDALLEIAAHKPFECVGEGRESRAAMAALSARAEWREDALVARFAGHQAALLDPAELALAPLLAPAAEHFLPARLHGLLDAH
ncbi:MAG: UDP-N-acetyl-alpha-D-muramoyl-L-alanyl-L-glutamate epimerase [Lysobacterales bacterium]